MNAIDHTRYADNLTIAPTGGRIKSAGVGLDLLGDLRQPIALDARIRELRKAPPPELLLAFFPGDRARIRHMLEGIGFFRPFLKTDQGMGGTFAPFTVNPDRDAPQYPATFREFEYVALPEMHADLDAETITHMQDVFYAQNFRATAEAHAQLGTREANKGRSSFFFIRPAVTSAPAIMSQSVLHGIETAMNELLRKTRQQAADAEREATGDVRPANLIYCQPDAYVDASGRVHIERIQTPDVGCFINELAHPHAHVLHRVQDVMRTSGEAIVRAIETSIGHTRREIALVTRRGVLERHEDMLELLEMRYLQKRLSERGYHAISYSLASVADIPRGTPTLLMNIDYTRHDEVAPLLERHARGEIDTYPNPYVQHALRRATGLATYTTTSKKHIQRLIETAKGLPKHDDAHLQKIETLRAILEKIGVTDDTLLHVDIGNETIPILTSSSISWRTFATRAEKIAEDHNTPITELQMHFRAIPFSAEHHLVTGPHGPHLHVFRSTATISDD